MNNDNSALQAAGREVGRELATRMLAGGDLGPLHFARACQELVTVGTWGPREIGFAFGLSTALLAATR